jgi:hypothetical protein
MPERNLSLLKPFLSGLAKLVYTIELVSPDKCIRIEE